MADRGTMLIACKRENYDDCMLMIKSFQSRHKDNVIGVYKTIPFLNPAAINANVSGSTNVIMEFIANKNTSIQELKSQFESEMTSNIIKPITMY